MVAEADRTEPTTALWILAATQLVAQCSVIAIRGVEYSAATLAIDDTFYYLQTAWNLRELGFASFDGLHGTNGVQLLWFGAVSGLAWLAPSREALLQGTMCLCFALNAACYPVIGAIGRRLGRPPLTFFLAALWCYQSLFSPVYSTGMESSLHALVFWLVIARLLTAMDRVERGEAPPLLGFTALLVLNAWTRLDAGLFSAVLYLSLLTRWTTRVGGVAALWSTHRGRLLASLAVAAAGLSVQLALFQAMGGSPLPVSMLAKAGQLRLTSTRGSLYQLVNVTTWSLPHLSTAKPPRFAAIGVALVALALLWRQRETLRRPRAGSVEWTWIALATGLVAYHATLLLLRNRYEIYFAWYRSPLYITWLFTFAVALRALRHDTDRRIAALGAARTVRALAVGLLLVSFAGFAVRSAYTHSAVDAFESKRYQAARWLRQHFPPDTLFSAWNAGQLGFFSERRFVNLDGLANDYAYYRGVLRGDQPLLDYLQESGVEYVVDYVKPHLPDDLPVVRVFFTNVRGRTLRIWQLPRPSETLEPADQPAGGRPDRSRRHSAKTPNTSARPAAR